VAARPRGSGPTAGNSASGGALDDLDYIDYIDDVIDRPRRGGNCRLSRTPKLPVAEAIAPARDRSFREAVGSAGIPDFRPGVSETFLELYRARW